MAILKCGGASDPIVYVLQSKDLPKTDHYAVLVDKTVHYTDAWNEDAYEKYVQYIAFDSQEELERWILNNHTRETFKIISSKPIAHQMKAVISFN